MTTSLRPDDLESAFAEVNGVRLHYKTAGAGPVVLLLHGFPEFWYCWREQIPALSERFRVIAPDLRGYNLSDKPSGKAAYTADVLLGDLTGLIDHLGEGPVRVVGHDWGAALTWGLATRHPEHVQKMAALSIPHPRVLLRALARSLDQVRRVWHFAFFQLPFVPEAYLKANDFAALKQRFYRDWSYRPEVFTEEDYALYVEAMSRPGALTASLNYYRSMLGGSDRGDVMGDPRKVQCPGLVLLGARDPLIGAGVRADFARMHEYFADGTYIFREIPASGHWVQFENAAAVNAALLEFL